MSPYCPKCVGYLFGDGACLTDPCFCRNHDSKTIADSLVHVADTMKRVVALMRAFDECDNSERGKLLLQHASEMQGAAEMCIDWAENLESTVHVTPEASKLPIDEQPAVCDDDMERSYEEFWAQESEDDDDEWDDERHW